MKGWANTFAFGPCITSVRKINLHKQLRWRSMMNLPDSVSILYYQPTLLVRVI